MYYLAVCNMQQSVLTLTLALAYTLTLVVATPYDHSHDVVGIVNTSSGHRFSGVHPLFWPSFMGSTVRRAYRFIRSDTFRRVVFGRYTTNSSALFGPAPFLDKRALLAHRPSGLALLEKKMDRWTAD